MSEPSSRPSDATLVCPLDRQLLHPAPMVLIDELNAAIGARSLRDASGSLVTQPMQAGLLRADGLRLYPVIEGIPMLLVDAAILVTPAPG